MRAAPLFLMLLVVASAGAETNSAPASVPPTPDDLFAGRDPVLARAAEILGATIDPKAAASMFPAQWR